jgi:hypothetical protein
MNLWQQAAIRYPALLAEETMYPYLRHVVKTGTLVLSVNAGYE